MKYRQKYLHEIFIFSLVRVSAAVWVGRCSFSAFFVGTVNCDTSKIKTLPILSGNIRKFDIYGLIGINVIMTDLKIMTKTEMIPILLPKKENM